MSGTFLPVELWAPQDYHEILDSPDDRDEGLREHKRGKIYGNGRIALCAYEPTALCYIKVSESRTQVNFFSVSENEVLYYIRQAPKSMPRRYKCRKIE